MQYIKLTINSEWTIRQSKLLIVLISKAAHLGGFRPLDVVARSVD